MVGILRLDSVIFLHKITFWMHLSRHRGDSDRFYEEKPVMNAKITLIPGFL